MRQILKRWFELLVLIISLLFLGWLISYQGGPDTDNYTTTEVARKNLIKSVSVTATLKKVKDDKFLESFLSEKEYLEVDEEDDLEIVFDSLPDETLNGSIRHISEDPIVRGNTTDYLIEFNIEDLPDEILAGMHAEVKIIIDRKDDRLALPNLAIKKEGDEYVVDQVTVERRLRLSRLNFERTKQTIKQIPVEIGFEGDEYTEITSGLKLGDVVVSSTFE